MTAPAPPPDLAGYDYIDLLGSGGFADVYLYEQRMPRRRVAVKVLREQGLTDDVRQEFTSEANVMASLSSHPYIVTIYGADVSADGRPYIVMEYYSGDNLSVRCRQRPLGVSEALRIGVQISGAVHTAHLAGVLHRDRKPANILTSAFGKPGLTDFGISAVKAEGDTGGGGVSIPWSPPELLTDDGVADERSDVYSLAATVFTLLVGRSPFEVAGGSNSALELMSRIERQSVPSTGRSEAPAALDRVLATAMSKSPDGRPESAATFARSLQAIEREMRLQPTDLDIPDAGDPGSATAPPAARAWGPDTDGTRLRQPTTISAQPVTEPQATSRVQITPTPEPPSSLVEGTIRRAAPTREDRTVLRPTVVDTSGTTPAAATRLDETTLPPPASRGRALLLIGGATAVAVLGIGAVVALGGRTSATDATSPGAASAAPSRKELAPPTGLSFRRNGSTVTVSWTAPPDVSPGDYYTLKRTDVPSEAVAVSPAGATSYDIAGVAKSSRVCVKVLYTDGSDYSPELTGCESS